MSIPPGPRKPGIEKTPDVKPTVETTRMLTDLYPVSAAQNYAVIGNARRPVHPEPDDAGTFSLPHPLPSTRDPFLLPVLDQVEEGLSRAMQLNADLRNSMVNTVQAEELVRAGFNLVTGLKNNPPYPAAGEITTLKDDLGETVSLLRHTYRKILIREDLPPATAREVLLVAQLFDKSAGSLGFY